MNALDMAKTAYGTPGTPVRTERSTEYDLLARTTRRLREAQRAAKTDVTSMVEALHENRRLWTTLAVNVADKENGLPRDLRARLFYLAQFTLAHTSKVLSKKASAEVLIEINTAVMRGLAVQKGVP